MPDGVKRTGGKVIVLSANDPKRTCAPIVKLDLLYRGSSAVAKIFKHGARNIVAFYLPGDLFGWTDLQHSLSIEATTDTEVLFLKRRALLSIASREIRVASFFLAATTNELGRAQDHILLMSKSAKCRLATFLTDFWVRLGNSEYLDVPMSYQDIADHVGLTIETVSIWNAREW
jgi:CRP/FNR family nitrogen fixation transcriptional regulator